MRFIFEHARSGSERLGALTEFVRNPNAVIETPACALLTQGGSVVHLTAEVLSNVFTEPCLLWIPLSNSLSLEPGVKAQGKGICEFAGISQHITCVTLSNMNEITPMGHFEPDTVPLWTKQGKKLVTADRYMDIMELFKPDIFFAIADNRTSLSEGPKRIAKAVERTCSMLDKCVSRYKGSDPLKHKSSLVGVIVAPGDEKRLNECINHILGYGDTISGIALSGLTDGNEDASEIPIETLQEIFRKVANAIPKDRVRFVEGSWSPTVMMSAIECGWDILDGSYAVKLTNAGQALVLNFDVNRRSEESCVLDMVNVRRESPEREPCEFLASTSSRIQILVAMEVAPEQPAEQVANIEFLDIDLASPSPEALFREGNNMNVGAEYEVRTAVPSTSRQRISTGINDINFTKTIDEWMQFVDDMSDDDDDNLIIDSEPCSLPTLTPRDASAEPATEYDLTGLQASILTDEDRLNDLAVRNIVPNDDCYTFNWKGDKQTFAGQRETFDMTSGPTFGVTDQTSVVDVFYKMFDSDFIDLLCTQTNLYASQKIALLKNSNKLLPNSRLHRWTPTDRDEMISFLAIGILQGLYPLPEEESYFSFNGFGTMPYFSKIMSYNRYLLLKSLLHFIDNETLTEPNKLTKIQPVTDYFNDKFSNLYYPSREIVIDESLLKWHGRLGFAQKILSKAAQVGVKTYELCESASGYLWKFYVYAGKDKPRMTDTHEDGPNDDDETETTTNDNTREQLATATATDTQPTNATAKIVYQLVTPLLDRGHTLIMDNFYNSPLLVRCLKKRKTDCFGTLRLNREFVPDSLKTLKQSDLRQGEIVASYCSDISVMAWRDAKIVSMISTFHRLQIGTTDKYDRLKYKPNIVLDYNKSMGGVDRKDQFLSAQPMERVRNKVWYKKLFRRLFSTAVFNCFIIYSTAHRNVSHRQFRTILAEDLLKRHRQVDLTTEPRLSMTRSGLHITTTKPSTSTRPKLQHKHFPVKTGFKKSRCWMCAQQKVCSRTVWKCLQCDVNLCIEGCFMAYHT